MLDRFGVTHVLSGEPLQGDLQLVASDPGGYCLSPEKGWWIYTNPGAARRAFFDGSSGTGTGTATVTEHHGDDVLIEVESPGAVLVVTEANAPGWQAFIDGIPATLSTADEIFRAVSVPEGRHEVRLVYRPESFRVGFFVAIAGLFTALVLLPLAAVRFGK
jgi:hypothetical protein